MKRRTMIHVDQHLRRHIGCSTTLCVITRSAATAWLFAYGSAMGNLSSGMSAKAPAFTMYPRRSANAQKRARVPNSPASTTCLRILSALAKLTTGPRLVSGCVGSPNLNPYIQTSDIFSTTAKSGTEMNEPRRHSQSWPQTNHR